MPLGPSGRALDGCHVVSLAAHLPGPLAARQLMALGADIVKVFPAETVGPAFFKAMRGPLPQVRLMPTGGVDLTTDEELPNMGDEPIGIVTASNYSAAATRPANLQFMASWRREYGNDALAPNFFAVQGWDGMDAIFAVIKATKGEVTGDAAMKVLAGWKTDASPRGPIMIDPETRDIVENVYIRRVEKVEGKLANVEFFTFPMVKDPWKEEHPLK